MATNQNKDRLWYQNPQITNYVQSTLKRSNQRIAQLTKTFGEDSATWRQEVGKFKKKGYSQWMSVSEGGKKIGRAGKQGKETKGGNVKFDVRKINQAIRSGSVSRSEINRFLADAAGILIQPDGSIKELKRAVDVNGKTKYIDDGGIPSTSQILRKTEKKLERMGEDPAEKSRKELLDITKTLAEFSENFDTTYDAFINKYGEEEGKKDPVISQLWGEREKRLSYSKLQEIRKKMEAMLLEAASDAISFEVDELKRQAETDAAIKKLTKKKRK